jgi:hypothetical protein
MVNHEVISAFLDNETFDPQALSAALADPEGRALLIDLLTLRRLAQPDEIDSAQPSGRSRAPGVGRLAAIAAALTLAVVGGYQLGERSGVGQTDPPAPTRVISSATAWQDVSQGGVR